MLISHKSDLVNVSTLMAWLINKERRF